MNLKPLNDNLIIKPLEEKSSVTIVLPDSEKENPEKGEVVAVGPGRVLDNGNRLPMGVKVGDKVMFKKYSPDKIEFGDKEFLVLKESDVIAVIV